MKETDLHHHQTSFQMLLAWTCTEGKSVIYFYPGDVGATKNRLIENITSDKSKALTAIKQWQHN